MVDHSERVRLEPMITYFWRIKIDTDHTADAASVIYAWANSDSYFSIIIQEVKLMK